MEQKKDKTQPDKEQRSQVGGNASPQKQQKDVNPPKSKQDENLVLHTAGGEMPDTSKVTPIDEKRDERKKQDKKAA